MYITLAIPLYNEEAVCGELIRQLSLAIQNLEQHTFLLIFIDDGSSDKTVEILQKEIDSKFTYKIISLSRNFGHQAALTTALDFSEGDAVIIMDGDLQDSPNLISQFIKKHHEGFDVVYAERISRHESFILKICYHLFYRLLGKLSHLNIPLDSGDFSLISKRVVEVLKRTQEKHKFIRGLRAWAGFRQVGIPVERSKRFAGQPKYNFKKLFALAFDGIFSFSIIPLRIASICGLLTILGCFAFLTYAIIEKLFLNPVPTGFPALVVSILFTSGVQLFFLGIIGEYVGRIYEQSKERPTYVIDKIITNDRVADIESK